MTYLEQNVPQRTGQPSGVFCAAHWRKKYLTTYSVFRHRYKVVRQLIVAQNKKRLLNSPSLSF